MNTKTVVTISGILASLAILATFVWTFDRTRAQDIRGAGAVEEKFKECCDRVDTLANQIEAGQDRQDKDVSAGVARITALESRAEWNSRRIDGLQQRQEDILKELGIIEGKVDQILQSARGGRP